MSTILIIEDEARIAAFIAKGLKSAGFASHATASGAEGASLALHGGFDLASRFHDGGWTVAA
jgi:DNA-binding response OmpR family regulator